MFFFVSAPSFRGKPGISSLLSHVPRTRHPPLQAALIGRSVYFPADLFLLQLAAAKARRWPFPFFPLQRLSLSVLMEGCQL